jgi:hypothetical protein
LERLVFHGMPGRVNHSNLLGLGLTLAVIITEFKNKAAN